MSRKIVPVEELDKNLQMTRRGFIGVLSALGVQGLVDPAGLVEEVPVAATTKHAGKAAVADFSVTVDGVDLTHSIRYISLSNEFDTALTTSYGDSFHSYAPGIMTTKFDMELLGTDWNPPVDRRDVELVVRSCGVEYSFSAYLMEARRIFEGHGLGLTSCQFTANGAVTQKVIDKSGRVA